jgi:hypothetical protein
MRVLLGDHHLLMVAVSVTHAHAADSASETTGFAMSERRATTPSAGRAPLSRPARTRRPEGCNFANQRRIHAQSGSPEAEAVREDSEGWPTASADDAGPDRSMVVTRSRGCPAGRNALQMLTVPDKGPIQTLGADGAHPTLGVGVRPRRARGPAAAPPCSRGPVPSSPRRASCRAGVRGDPRERAPVRADDRESGA